SLACRPALEQVAAGDERVNLGVCDRPGEHPEAAVRVNVGDAFGAAQDVRSGLDPVCDFVRLFDHGGLDVDHAHPQLQLRIDVAQDLEVAIAGTRELQHHVVDTQQVDNLHQPRPAACLDALAAVVAETQMDGRLVRDRVEDA